MISKALVIFGATVLSLGIIFHLQGQSVVGPESSFMYKNPDWITYGMQIAIVGAVIIISGITIKVIKRN